MKFYEQDGCIIIDPLTGGFANPFDKAVVAAQFSVDEQDRLVFTLTEQVYNTSYSALAVNWVNGSDTAISDTGTNATDYAAILAYYTAMKV